MIYQIAVRSVEPGQNKGLRWWFVDAVDRRCQRDRLVFVGLLLWDVVDTDPHAPEGPAIGPRWLHRIEVELLPAGERKPTSRETITGLMSADEFRAVERRGCAL